ncbi:hypothetical protein CYLTODRAFT_488850 [Cylindrobasidium torrendii FP15055 ss-10]|uniref:Uncharacterized protein n=1 Tax=Cylindrobasidium torrendii FP15055 ss-10 TaxID=1314674 RepID=A0A0D7BG78_9AGAR|nr:hypothetical protein CYLTODRAFT_488850 [Cylindrobasidium torrendii FP15055 ss-10]
MSFPSPVGGLTQPSEFVISVLVCLAFGLLLVLAVIQACQGRGTLAVCATAGVVIERAISFGLRAAVVKHPHTESEGLSEYLQVTFAMGSVMILGDVMNVLACALVQSTKVEGAQVTTFNSGPTSTGSTRSKISGSGMNGNIPEEKQEANQQRRKYVRLFGWVQCTVWMLCLAAGFTGNSLLIAKRKNPQWNKVNQALRYTSTGIAFAIALWLAGATFYWRARLNNLARRLALLFCGLLSIPWVYRLCVMHYTIPALDAHIWGSQNLPAEKALFYTFHVLPEFILASLMLGAVDVRGVFNTGAMGGGKGWEGWSKSCGRRLKESYGIH